MGLDLTNPSTISFSMPDWRGGIIRYAGGIKDVGALIWDDTRAFVDPVLKAPERLENEVKLKFYQGEAGVFSFIGDALSGISDTAKSVASPILAPLQSGLKWGMILLVIGIAIYVLAVVGPFLPKPKGS